MDRSKGKEKQESFDEKSHKLYFSAFEIKI